jgi:hypothetical protein
MREKFKNLIFNDEIDKALKLLLEVTKDTEHYDEVGLVSRRLRKLKSNTNKGHLSFQLESS